jgi:hypothetical protein
MQTLQQHGNWKGGCKGTWKAIAQQSGKDITHCQICKESPRRIEIHHIDGNQSNNNPRNLGVLCSFCHQSIHDNGNKTRFKQGQSHSIETRTKMSQAKKGVAPWNKGKQYGKIDWKNKEQVKSYMREYHQKRKGEKQ